MRSCRNAELRNKAHLRWRPLPRAAGRALALELHNNGMPLYRFKLVDSHLVTDYGEHDLIDDTIAQIEAIKLSRSLRMERPELRGQHCSISVTDEYGAGVCVIPIDDI
jgi:hypothetical protein